MYPLSSSSLHSAHTTLLPLASRYAVSSADLLLLCLRALSLSRALLYPTDRSVGFGPLTALVNFRLAFGNPRLSLSDESISCAYRCSSLDSHSRLELSIVSRCLDYRVTMPGSPAAGDPLGSKPRSIVPGVNHSVARRRKIFKGWAGPAIQESSGSAGQSLSAHKPCSRVAQSWQASYQASGEAKTKSVQAIEESGGAIAWSGEGIGGDEPSGLPHLC